ncbi:hypothetical protein Misp02_54620 [Microtetraspora sp. NBRC 16547]|nr:hypothetical protein Misp02_54620 [Microtetraspora sp. NBRC 16547]
MPPLYPVATGFLITSLALRINGFDILVDAVGWLLVVFGLSHMEASIDPVFGKAKVAAIVTLVLSAAELVGLTVHVVIGLLYGLSRMATIWLVAEGIITRAQAFGDVSTASTFNALRWVLAIVSVVGWLIGYTGAPVPIIALIVVIIGLGAILWFTICLYRSARLPYLVSASRP